MVNEVNIGNVLSEESHYKVLAVDSLTGAIKATHCESGEEVTINSDYIKKFLNSADEFTEIVKVTKEDKLDGTLGIRSIFESIHTSEVFTVTFTKQAKDKTKGQIAQEKNAQINEAIELITRAKEHKKSMADAYAEALTFVQNNPIRDYIPGEERTLRGYKVQFHSRDGKYRCIDLDIPVSEKETGERLVNINTISSLIYRGVKYVAE